MRLTKYLPPGWEEQLRATADRIAVEGACVTNSIAETIVKQGFFANRPHQNSAQLHYVACSFHRKRSPFLPEEGIVLTASKVGCGGICLKMFAKFRPLNKQFVTHN